LDFGDDDRETEAVDLGFLLIIFVNLDTLDCVIDVPISYFSAHLLYKYFTFAASLMGVRVLGCLIWDILPFI
jgi:hypothetical protein